jgi:anaerobic magnesium-protoporphyrin IX monomethyl ester cyclase
MADAILINPKGLNLINDKILPFGLLCTSVYASQEFDLVIIDKRVESSWKSRLTKELKKNPKIVAITCMTGPQITDALSISKFVKQNSKAKVVWGGIHPSLLPRQTLENQFIDIIIQGEGEITFFELLKTISENKHLKNVMGIWYKEGSNIKKTKERKFITNLDNLPNLPYHLIDINKYIETKKAKPQEKSISILTSRGCPNQCIYCFHKSFNKSCWRALSAERVVKEVEYFSKKYNITNLFIIDDNFFVNKRRVLDIINSDIFKHGKISLDILGASIEAVDSLTNEELKMLHNRGLRSVLFGVESGSQKILDYIRKGITVEQVIRVNQRLGRLGVRANYSFMTGFPKETREDIISTIKLISRLEKDNPLVNKGTVKPVICYPGTQMYKIALEEGYKTPSKLEDWANIITSNYNKIDYPWISKKRKEFLLNLYFYSVLSNPDYSLVNSKIFKIGVTILKPITSYRFKNLNFSFPIESTIANWIKKHLI